MVTYHLPREKRFLIINSKNIERRSYLLTKRFLQVEKRNITASKVKIYSPDAIKDEFIEARELSQNIDAA